MLSTNEYIRCLLSQNCYCIKEAPLDNIVLVGLEGQRLCFLNDKMQKIVCMFNSENNKMQWILVNTKILPLHHGDWTCWIHHQYIKNCQSLKDAKSWQDVEHRSRICFTKTCDTSTLRIRTKGSCDILSWDRKFPIAPKTRQESTKPLQDQTSPALTSLFRTKNIEITCNDE